MPNNILTLYISKVLWSSRPTRPMF